MNISLLLDMAADGFGDRVLVGRKSAGLTGQRVRRLSIAGARLIRSAGADSLVYLGVNGPAFPVALFAAARAGVPLVPLSAQETEAALLSVPPYHIAAVANAVTNLYAGRRTVVLEQFTPAEWLDLVRAEEISNALVVPTMLARIIEKADDAGPADAADPAGQSKGAVPSLRALAYGGARMPAAVIERALRRWPQVGFVNAYGLTETSSTIAVLGPDDHRAALASTDPAVRARLGSAGRPVPGRLPRR